MNTLKYNIIPFNDTCDNSLITPHELYIKSNNNDPRKILCNSDGSIVDFTGIINAYFTESNETFATYSFKNGFLHSYDGNPAEISPTAKKWYFDGKLHKEDGPAIVYNENYDLKAIYFLHGIAYSLKEYLKRIPEKNAILLSLQV